VKIDRTLCLAVLAVASLLGRPAHGAESPADAARRAREEEEARKRRAAAPKVGEPRVVARKSVRVVDKEEWDRLHKKPSPTDETKLTVVSEKHLKASATQLGRTLRVLQGEGYRLSRKEVLAYGGVTRIAKMPYGFAVDAAGSVHVYDRGGRRVLTKTPASIWSVNGSGRVGLYNNVRGTFSTDRPTEFHLLSTGGRVVYTLPLSNASAVDIAPDGKSIMAWQKSLGNLIGPTIYPMSGRPRGRMHQYNVSEKVRFVTRTGSVICLSARVRGSSRTVYHLSPTGKAIYTKSGSFFPSAATPDGYLLCRTSRVPRRLFILDPSGKEIFSKQGAEYPTGTFVNGHEYLAIRSLPGHRELHATFFRVKDGKELCEIPSTCLRGACLIDGGRVLCYDPSEQLLTVYDLATGRRLRRTVLRHGERGSLKVTEARMENGAMLLTLRGSASGEGPLIYYKIELTEK